jgi:hypothetical protein
LSILQRLSEHDEGSRRRSICPNIFRPTMDISSMTMYLVVDIACWSVWSPFPSNCLNSPLVGRRNSEWRVVPSMMKDETPVGAATYRLSPKSSLMHWMT